VFWVPMTIKVNTYASVDVPKNILKCGCISLHTRVGTIPLWRCAPSFAERELLVARAFEDQEGETSS